jgi:dienelactone hydrolase
LGSFRLLLDYLTTRSEVEPEALGCVGLSYGAMATLFLTAIEPRIRAAVVSGGLSSYEAMLEHDATVCAGQVIPGMMEWFDLPDVAMAIAPRPVLYEIMRRDSCFDFTRAQAVWKQVAEVYAGLGVSNHIGMDTPDTDHRYSGVHAPAFFRRFLGKGGTA